MKRILMLILLGLFTFAGAASVGGCRAGAEIDPDDDAEIEVDVD